MAFLDDLLKLNKENQYPMSPLDPMATAPPNPYDDMVAAALRGEGLAPTPTTSTGIPEALMKPEDYAQQDNIDNMVKRSLGMPLMGVPAPATPIPEPVAPPLEPVVPAAKTPPPSRRQAAPQPVEAPVVEQEVIQEPDEMADATRRRDDMMAALMLARGGEQIGSAIAGVKSDPEYLREIGEMSKNPIQDLLTKRKLAMDKLQGEKLKTDMDTAKLVQQEHARKIALEKGKDDPDSDISRLYRDSAKTMASRSEVLKTLDIPETLSAGDMEKYSPMLFNLVSQDLARQSRLDAAKLRADEKGDVRDEKKAENKKKFTQDLRKELTQGQFGKLYGNLGNTKKATEVVEQFKKNPTGYSDYGTLMLSLKALQGDESVVREAEIKLGMEAGSFKDQILNVVDKARTGKSLQPVQRDNILKAATVLADIAKRHYTEAISPILEQAGSEGIDTKFLLPKDLQITNTQEDPKIAIWAKEHNMSYDQAEQIIEKRKGTK